MLRNSGENAATYLYVEDLDDEVTEEFCLLNSLHHNIVRVRVGEITLDNIYKKQDLEQELKTRGRFLITSHNPNCISKSVLIQDVKNVNVYAWRKV